jgi:hypothetical protein
MTGLRVAVPPAGANPATWRLDPAQARIAHKLVTDSGAPVGVVAVDTAAAAGLARSRVRE